MVRVDQINLDQNSIQARALVSTYRTRAPQEMGKSTGNPTINFSRKVSSTELQGLYSIRRNSSPQVLAVFLSLCRPIYEYISR
jgi:hypothetical protein